MAVTLPAFSEPSEMVSTEQLATNVTQFLQKEIAANVVAVTNLNPPQKIVLGVPTAGDFTWGSFMRALSAVSMLTGETNVAGRDVPQFLGQLGLIESRQGGKTFSQLGAALTLKQFGMNLETNALWQSLSPSEQNEWRALLNPARFYDFKTHHVIDLPENYMGVASRIITMDVQFGLVTNLDVADDILQHAAGQFLRGAHYTDDNVPVGRYDRYSQEYARFVYLAAGNIERTDIQAADAPALKSVMKTWWALVSPDGYSYPWGRTIGDMSYIDTLDIIGFLAEHPEFRPAPLADLASVYFAAWNSLQRDYEPDRHLLNMFGFGRGNYTYMTPDRQWQQTTGFEAKAADSLRLLVAALRAEGISEFPAQPNLPPVARFDFFRTSSSPQSAVEDGRAAGVWLVRQGLMRFALPFTTGIRPGISDYLPAPHGLPGFAAPVEQLAPVLTPYLELTNGQLLVAGDGADEIIPAKNGLGVTAIWHRFAEINVAAGNTTNADFPWGEPEKFAEPGLTNEIVWKLDGKTLIRTEKISAAKPITIQKFSVIFPSTANSVSTRLERGQRIDTFTSADATLEVSAKNNGVPFTENLQATGNSVMGKGAREPIPLILQIEADNLQLKPGKPFEWTLRLRELPQ
ncbi:MAG TPA: hypothetical protein VMD27_02840 [Candidatus Aquilonibacter sp.]|nr:hypothetical protein [Candidatus Aquilonibacter sp.]